MKNLVYFYLIVAVIIIVPVIGLYSSYTLFTGKMTEKKGAYYTGNYRNIFTELLDISEPEVRARIEYIWAQLFYGNKTRERLYYTVEPDMAYIKDFAHNDVRSEGMSYGMMIAVQLNKKIEFDRLWKWAKTYMQYKNGQRKGYFAWQLDTEGNILDNSTASDGDEWIAAALFFASARWGNGTGIFNYQAEAQAILDAMLGKAESSDSDTVITNMFDKTEKQVVFVPSGANDYFTDPSYHLPHFYELWARWADKNNLFWCEAADASREFLKKAAHPETGLFPDFAYFNGKPADIWNGWHKDFRFDAWRVAMNIAVDYAWFARDEWAVYQSNRLLDFFYDQGIWNYGNQYTLDGKPLSGIHSPGLVAMNAVACLVSTNANKTDFVRELWNTPIPSGVYRYYDGLLYMLGMLNLSGNFKVYELAGNPVSACEGDF
jgi:oligosaccharide reducing-end xylanase